MNTMRSVNNIPIRLPDERWRHIVENHNGMAGYYYEVLETVENPKWIFEGDEGDVWAAKLINRIKPPPQVVVHILVIPFQ
jgi:hypothetical protein